MRVKILAFVIADFVLVLGVLGYYFRDEIFGASPKPASEATSTELIGSDA